MFAHFLILMGRPTLQTSSGQEDGRRGGEAKEALLPQEEEGVSRWRGGGQGQADGGGHRGRKAFARPTEEAEGDSSAGKGSRQGIQKSQVEANDTVSLSLTSESQNVADDRTDALETT